MTPDTARLTPTQITAQHAIATDPELHEIARKLAKWGLGIALPHRHTPEKEFDDLPADIVQVERGGIVSFVPREAASGMVPVAWRWTERGLDVAGACAPYQFCDPNVLGHLFVQGHTAY